MQTMTAAGVHGKQKAMWRGAGALWLLVAGSAAASVLAAGKARPNIVFIFTDDQRFDALGTVDPGVKTPNLDRLAARGVRYANAFVTLSICSPSRAAVMTGQYGSRNGVTTLGRRIAPSSPLVPRLLQQAGYRTAMFGKWHLGNKPTEIGFDQASYFVANGTYYGRKAIVDGKQMTVPGYIDQALADWSVSFIKRAHAEGKPFFLWHCTQAPHMDHTFDWPARPQWLRLYDPAAMPLPPSWQDDLAGKPPYLQTARSRARALKYGYDNPAALRRHLQRYRAAVSQMDATLGTILDTIDQLGLADNTWILFMGDNGWQIGEHRFTSKVLAYEPSMRVPMIVAGPGAKTRVDRRLALNIDLAATILDIAGLDIPAAMQGRSLLAPADSWRREFVYEVPRPVLGVHRLLAVRDSRWKLIHTYDPDRPDRLSFVELYDLENDPHEMHNLAGDPAHADRISRMARTLDQWRRAEWSGRRNVKSARPSRRSSPEPDDASVLQIPDPQPPPADWHVDPFYKKAISAGGYPIVASERVSDYALKEAAWLVNRMLAHRPDVREAMIRSGSRLCILAHNEFTTDLPEFAHLKPKDYWDARARGTGGSRSDPYCSCGEENLLGYPGDPYAAECILLHEFAHNIHLRGLVNLDPTFDRRLKETYEAAMRHGLWKGKYAAVNHHEYFAEGVQSWFGSNRENDHDHNHVNTRGELVEYDPGLAAICREVFGDDPWTYTKPATRLHGHLAGYDPARAPRFRWPERLKAVHARIVAEAKARERQALEEKNR